nr:hypothetical protein C5F59_39205 [Streptomyces sp. QL37]
MPGPTLAPALYEPGSRPLHRPGNPTRTTRGRSVRPEGGTGGHGRTTLATAPPVAASPLRPVGTALSLLRVVAAPVPCGCSRPVRVCRAQRVPTACGHRFRAVPAAAPSPGDKAYTSRRNRRYLRRRGIPHTIPERLDQQRHRKNRGSRGGRPTGFDNERYKKRNTVERTINRLTGYRAVATRHEKQCLPLRALRSSAAPPA